MIRNETGLGIGIEEYEGRDVKVIASIYVDGRHSRLQALRRGIDEVLRLAGECDRIVIKMPDTHARNARHKILPRGVYNVRLRQEKTRGMEYPRMLAEDALEVKQTIIERFK